VDRDENYVLGLKVNDVVESTDMITCVAYCQAKGGKLLVTKIVLLSFFKVCLYRCIISYIVCGVFTM